MAASDVARPNQGYATTSAARQEDDEQRGGQGQRRDGVQHDVDAFGVVDEHVVHRGLSLLDVFEGEEDHRQGEPLAQAEDGRLGEAQRRDSHRQRHHFTDQEQRDHARDDRDEPGPRPARRRHLEGLLHEEGRRRHEQGLDRRHGREAHHRPGAQAGGVEQRANGRPRRACAHAISA